jgi:L-ribulose-5-phosphate 4-epimerase
MGQYDVLKEAVWEANMEIPNRNLAIYTWGNVSQIDRKAGVFAIKPSGVPYEKLQIEDIVVVDMEGNVVEGSLRPSSDMETHLVIYRNFEKVGGITHTHSPHAVAWAQAGKSVPVYGTTHADHSHLPIPCTPMMGKDQVTGNYEYETGVLIVDVFKDIDPVHQPMVLVAGHGPFAWGKDAAASVYNAVVLEEICKMAWITLAVNPKTPPLPDYLTDKHYQRKHGPNAYYGQK